METNPLNDPKRRIAMGAPMALRDLVGIELAFVSWSQDAAVRLAKRCGRSEDEAGRIAYRVKALAAVLVERLGKAPEKRPTVGPATTMTAAEHEQWWQTYREWERTAPAREVRGAGMVARFEGDTDFHQHTLWVPGWTDDEVTRPDAAGVMWWADRAFLDVVAPYLDPADLQKSDRNARDRWVEFIGGGAVAPLDPVFWAVSPDDAERLHALWGPWLNGGRFKLLVAAARRWEGRESERGTRPVVKSGGDEYVGVSKAAPALSWALGAQGQNEVVELDGSRYAVVHKPRVVGVASSIPGRRVAQLGFPFETEAPAGLVVTAANDAAVLSPLVGKALVWLLCTVPRQGHFAASLEDLARTLHSHTKYRRQYAADLAGALREIRPLLLVLDDRTDVSLFDMRLPGAVAEADPAGVVEVGYSSAMMRATNPYHDDRGEVLLNRTAIEQMPLQNSLLLRAYVRSAGWWNDLLGMHKPLPEYSPAELAGVFNAMSEHAAHDQGAGRKQKSKRVGNVEDALAELEGKGLVELLAKGTGRHRRLVIAPPEAHREAYRLRRKRGARTDDE